MELAQELESKAIFLPNLGNGFAQKINLTIESKPYRNPCYIEAENDLQAVKSWLDSFKDKENTYKVYEKESVRFLLWCVYEKGKSLAALLKEDFEEYFRFISSVPDKWSMEGARYKKYSSKWRPFSGSISTLSARQTTIWAVNTLINYLVDAKYLEGNPAKLIKDPARKLNQELTSFNVQTRMLECDEWQAVQNIINNMPELTEFDIENKMRTRFLFALMYFTGMRRKELTSNPWCAFKQRQEQWWIFITGKGDKLGKVPVNAELLEHVKAYRRYLDKPELPTEDDHEKLFVSKKTGKPIQANTLYKQVKRIGVDAAKCFEGNPEKQQRLLNMSPHWLRHLSASHQDKLNIPARHIKDNHRHGDIRTTFKNYVHSEDDERFNEIQKMSASLDSKPLNHQALSRAFELTIKLEKGGVARGIAATRVLTFVEESLLNEYSWNYMGQDKVGSIEVFSQRAGSSLSMAYRVELSNKEQIDLISQAIFQQAQAWLFKCTIDIKECKS